MRGGFLGILLLGSGVSTAAAQTGLLVVAHGAGESWNAGVRAVVAQVHWPAGPVATAFLMGPEADSSGWNSALARLTQEGMSRLVVVPLLVSSHGGHYLDILHLAGVLADSSPDTAPHMHGGHSPSVPTAITTALDDAPEIGQVLDARWRELPATHRGQPLVLVAHGPTSDQDAAFWLQDLDRAAAGIRRAGQIPVGIGLLRDDAPPVVRAAAIAALRRTITSLAPRAGDSVTVLPTLISTGRIDQLTIPEDLLGLPISYTPRPLAPHPALARWIERVASAKATTLP